MNNQPLVSVIIPAYNRAVESQRAVNSVLAQKYDPLEILLIDDGSTDNTGEIFACYGPQVRYIRKDNGGVSSARNLGLELATGKIVIFLDSDDEFRPGFLAATLNYFSSNPDIHMCFALCSLVNERGEVVPPKHLLHDSQTNRRDTLSIFKNPYLPMSGIAIRDTLLQKGIRFDHQLRTAEDTDYLLKLSKYSYMGQINEDLVVIHVGSSGLSSEEISYTDEIKVYERFVDENPDFNNAHQLDIRRIFARIYFNYADELMFRRNFKRAIPVLIKSMSYQWRLKTLTFLGKSFLLLPLNHN